MYKRKEEGERMVCLGNERQMYTFYLVETDTEEMFKWRGLNQKEMTSVGRVS